MPEERSGGTPESPTGNDSGGTTSSSPGGGQGQPNEPSREQYIPRERFDEVNERLRQAELELQQRSQPQPTAGGARRWEDLSREELDYIVTHPDEYGQHMSAAIRERDRRLEDGIMSRVNDLVGAATYKMAHPEAFSVDTPLGREVARLMSNRPHAEVLKDVIELAKMRISAPERDSQTREQIAVNLAAASANPPGTATGTAPVPPAPMDQSKDDFEASVKSVKLRGM